VSGEAWRHVDSQQLLKAAKKSQLFLDTVLNQQKRLEQQSKRSSLMLQDDYDESLLNTASQPLVSLAIKKSK
jgi:hypothetical protein